MNVSVELGLGRFYRTKMVRPFSCDVPSCGTEAANTAGLNLAGTLHRQQNVRGSHVFAKGRPESTILGAGHGAVFSLDHDRYAPPASAVILIRRMGQFGWLQNRHGR